MLELAHGLFVHGLADGDLALVVAALGEFVGNIIGGMFLAGARHRELLESVSGGNLRLAFLLGLGLHASEPGAEIKLTH